MHPDFSKLTLAIGGKGPGPESQEPPAFAFDDEVLYRSLGPPPKRTRVDSDSIVVRSVCLLPRPPDALPTYKLMELALEQPLCRRLYYPPLRAG